MTRSLYAVVYRAGLLPTYAASKKNVETRNTLDCDQSNYSSRIVFSHIPIEFGQTGISAIRSADLENPTVEPS